MRSTKTRSKRPPIPPRAALLCGVALLCACWPSATPARGQGGAQPRAARDEGRVMLGVRLRPELAAWLAEVESRLGREVYAEFAPLGPEDGGEGFVGGENYVTERGAAVLRLNLVFQGEANRRRREATLAHELLHLRQRARGFAAYAFDESRPPARGVPLRELVETGVAGDLMEAIEHKLILPEMRRLGLDTVEDMIGFLGWARRQRPSPDHPSYAVYYVRASFEYTDPAKLRELEQTYRRNGWARSLARGGAVVRTLRAASVRTPADMTDTYLRCLTELFGGVYQFAARVPPPEHPRDRVFPTVLLSVRRATKK